MKKYSLIILFLLCINSSLSQLFTIDYKSNFEKATNFYSEKQAFFKHIICDKYKLDAQELFSIVAPEVAFYFDLQDFAETSTLQLFYTELGSDYANFSIGLFQMKPSFVERLEYCVIQNSNLQQYRFIADFPEKDIKKIRSVRLERLQSITWQTYYLCTFYSYMEERYGNKEFASTVEKLCFYATAYNRGFECDEKEIERWLKIKHFPATFQKDKFAYADVVKEFYVYLKK